MLRDLFRSTAFKVTAVVVLALALQGAAILGYFSWSVFRFAEERGERFREDTMTSEKERLLNLTQLAVTVVDSYYRRSQDLDGLKREKMRELKKVVDAVVSQAQAALKTHGRAEAEEIIKRQVAAVRFDDGNYVWINDLTPAMVLHPIRPELNGQDLRQNKDPKGKALFVEMVEAVKKGDGEGLVDYWWAKPGEKEPKLKISYVRLVPELGWIFGSGAWIEDITADMQRQALTQVARMRLPDGNYFWINDTTLPAPRMIMHPTSPALDGALLSDPKYDCATLAQAGVKGKVVDLGGKKNLFASMVEVVKEAGEGYVTYLWPKPKPGGGATEERFPKLSYVKLFEPWGWVVGMGAYVDNIDAAAGAQKAEMRGTVSGMVGRSLSFGLFFVALFGIISAVLLRRNIGKPLGALVRYFNTVAQGDLEASMTSSFSGEMGILQRHMQDMVGSLKAKVKESNELAQVSREETERARVATQQAEQARREAEQAKRQGMLEAAASIEEAVDGLSRASEALSGQVREVTHAGESQRQRTEETATAMEQMNSTVMEVARNAELAASAAEETRKTAAEGADIVRRSVGAMDRVHELAAGLKSDMETLAGQAEAIGRIVNVINDIADQTNLLALNAAIEAARAGDAGRGFAVVADEVRKLAEKTMTATKEVSDAVQSIQSGAERNRQGVDQAAAAVQQATELVNSSGDSLALIVTRVQEAADQVRSIATASEEQSAASEEITRSVEDVSRLTAETSQGMAEAARSLEDLARLAAELKALVDRLRAG
jgi:methyl-accepting chemotaxis protein